jgi:hypothetical protein
VEDSGVGCPFIEGVRNAWGQTILSTNHHIGILPQTIISVKPLYAWFGHYTLKTMVCQAHFMHKKNIKNQEKLYLFVIKLSKHIRNYPK